MLEDWAVAALVVVLVVLGVVVQAVLAGGVLDALAVLLVLLVDNDKEWRFTMIDWCNLTRTLWVLPLTYPPRPSLAEANQWAWMLTC